MSTTHHPRRRTNELITGREAAARLNVHENTVRNWANEGVLRVAEVLPNTRTRRYAVKDVEALKQQMALSAATPERDSQAGAYQPVPEQHQMARQIAEQLRAASTTLPVGDHIGIAGSTPHGAIFAIERDGHLYSVVVLPSDYVMIQ